MMRDERRGCGPPDVFSIGMRLYCKSRTSRTENRVYYRGGKSHTTSDKSEYITGEFRRRA